MGQIFLPLESARGKQTVKHLVTRPSSYLSLCLYIGAGRAGRLLQFDWLIKVDRAEGLINAAF